MTGEELYRRVNDSDDFGDLPEHLQAVWDMRARSFPFTRSPQVNTEEREQLPVLPAWSYALAYSIRRWGDFTGQLPLGPTRVRNTAAKNGWEVCVRWARGVWQSRGKAFLIDPAAGPVEEAEEDETDEAAADPAPGKIPALYEVIAVHGRRGDSRVAATWIRKPWTKVGASGGWEFQGAHIWPAHLNGGLHDSKTLNAYLKSEEGL